MDYKKFENLAKQLGPFNEEQKKAVIIFYTTGSTKNINIQQLVEEAIVGYDYSAEELDFEVEHEIFEFESSKNANNAIKTAMSVKYHIKMFGKDNQRDCFCHEMTNDEYHRYKKVRHI